MLGEREANDLERSREYIAAAHARVHVAIRSLDERVLAPDVGCGRCTGGELYGSEDQYLGLCPNCNSPQSLTASLFPEYSCKRCSSYLHRDEDHGEQR